jgi:hypothetical protein
MKCIFIGYSSSTKGYRLYNPESRLALTNRDVIFSENTLLSDGSSSSSGKPHSLPIDPGEFYFPEPESSSLQPRPTHSLPLNQPSNFKTDNSTHIPQEPPNQEPPKTPPLLMMKIQSLYLQLLHISIFISVKPNLVLLLTFGDPHVPLKVNDILRDFMTLTSTALAS